MRRQGGKERKIRTEIERNGDGEKEENLGNRAAFDFFYTPLEFEKFVFESCQMPIQRFFRKSKNP